MGNDLVPQNDERRGTITVHDAVPLFDTAKFEHMQRIATLMGRASLIPDHLKVIVGGKVDVEGTIGNCFLIVSKAERWKMDAIEVAQSTSLVHGKLCYEGKLIAAVLEAKLNLRLKYEWFGDEGTDGYGIKIVNPNNANEWISGTVGDWKTKTKEGADNKNWVGATNQRKQLKYRGDREWVRMWQPALLLGVYSDDEMAELEIDARARRAVNVTPIADRLKGSSTAETDLRENVAEVIGVDLAKTGSDTTVGVTVEDGKIVDAKEIPSSAETTAAPTQETEKDVTETSGDQPPQNGTAEADSSRDGASVSASAPNPPQGDRLLDDLNEAYGKCDTVEAHKAVTQSFRDKIATRDSTIKQFANAIKKQHLDRITSKA